MGGEGVAQRGVADEAEFDQHLAERAFALLLLVQRDAQLVGADQAGVEQELADRQGGVHGRCSVSLPPWLGTSSGRIGIDGKLRRPGEGRETRKSGPGSWLA